MPRVFRLLVPVAMKGILLPIENHCSDSTATTIGIIFAITFLGGGFFFATIQVKDEQGYAFISGKSVLGNMGLVPPLVGVSFSG